MTSKTLMMLTIAVTLLGFSIGHASDAPKPVLVENCYHTKDTDADTELKVQIYLDQRGHYLEVQDKNGRIIATQVPVVLKGKRSSQSASWRFDTPDSLFGLIEGTATFELYRTNKSERNPTTLNAHFNFDSNAVTLKSYRMECELKDL